MDVHNPVELDVLNHAVLVALPVAQLLAVAVEARVLVTAPAQMELLHLLVHHTEATVMGALQPAAVDVLQAVNLIAQEVVEQTAHLLVALPVLVDVGLTAVQVVKVVLDVLDVQDVTQNAPATAMQVQEDVVVAAVLGYACPDVPLTATALVKMDVETVVKVDVLDVVITAQADVATSVQVDVNTGVVQDVLVRVTVAVVSALHHVEVVLDAQDVGELAVQDNVPATVKGDVLEVVAPHVLVALENVEVTVLPVVVLLVLSGALVALVHVLKPAEAAPGVLDALVALAPATMIA